MSPAVQISSGVLGYIPEVLPGRVSLDWKDEAALARFYRELPVFQLLRERYLFLWEKGRLSPEFFHVCGLVVSEWLGLFGYERGQILPGLRVCLPRSIVEKAFVDAECFEALSLGFFSTFLERPLEGGGLSLKSGTFMFSLAGNFLNGVKIGAVEDAGVLYWGLSHPARPGFCEVYRFNPAARVFSSVVFDSAKMSESWKPVSGSNLLRYLLFPASCRHFWETGREFFEKFKFSTPVLPEFLHR